MNNFCGLAFLPHEDLSVLESREATTISIPSRNHMGSDRVLTGETLVFFLILMVPETNVSLSGGTDGVFAGLLGE